VHELLRQGYEPLALINYLANIMNSGYEEWRMTTPDANYRDYPFTMDKISSSGAIVDMVKIGSVSQETFARMSDEQIYHATFKRATSYHHHYVSILENNKASCIQAIGIERHEGNDPKRFITYQDVVDHCKLFIDSEFDQMSYPEDWTSLTTEQLAEFIKVYCDAVDLSLDKETWFAQLKEVGSSL